MKNLFLSLLLVFLLSTSFAQSVLWKVSGNGLLKPSYLFGTIHLQNSHVFELSDSLLPAIEHTDKLALELDLNNVDPTQMMKMMMLEPGKTLKDLFSEKDFLILKQGFEKNTGLSIDPFLGLKPFAIMSLIMLNKSNGDDTAPAALDQFLNYYAVALNKPVLGIETIEEQLNVFEALPNRAIIECLQEEDSVDMMIDSLLITYKKGDLTTLSLLLEEDQSYGKWMDKLLDDRNVIMFERTEAYLKKGESLVIAVGAGHLPGEKGLINLYKNSGYSVAPVLGTKSPVTNEVWQDVLKHKKF